MTMTKNEALALAGEVLDVKGAHAVARAVRAAIESGDGDRVVADDLVLPWFDHPVGFGKPGERGYTWRDMLDGSTNGMRHSWLRWLVKTPLSGMHNVPTAQYRARVCLAEGYGEVLP